MPTHTPITGVPASTAARSGASKPGRAQRPHALAEVPDAGDHDRVAAVERGGLLGHAHRRADAFERPRDRMEVPAAVVAHRDRRGHRYSAPFVEGTPPRPVCAHASPSAFASALNIASQM